MTEIQSEIKALEFPQNIRQNPQFMLGDLHDSSLLFRELFDNARDELIASKKCDTIWCDTKSEFHIVADNGRGISVALSDKGITQLELAVGSIYSSGKYDSKIAQGGMHGVGSSCVNAVSDVFKIACKITRENYSESYQEVKSFIESKVKDLNSEWYGYWLLIEYNKGIKVGQRIIDYEGIKKDFSSEVPDNMSTIVGFTADLTLVQSNSVRFSDSWSSYTSLALKKFYNKEINLIVDGQTRSIELTPYKYEITKDLILADPGINKSLKIYLTFEFDPDLNAHSTSGSVNLITVNQGLHIKIAEWAITNKLRQKFDIHHDFLTNGLKLTILMLANRVHYDSQTKTRLVSIDDLCDEDWYGLDDEIDAIFDSDIEVIKDHVKALEELAATYENLSHRERIMSMITINSQSGNRNRSYQPVKLIDASSEDREECELFLAEGDSASGTIMKVRDPEYHAVMPSRGVALNTVWMDLEGMSDNEEIMDIISGIGTGVDDIYDMDALRYGKIIIASDADPDGYHISALLLGLFAAHMRFLVESGKLYILESPLYKQDGRFIYREQEDTLDRSRPYERFKGLGSLKANSNEGRQEIRDIFINPETRHLIKVMPEGFDRAINAAGNKYTRKVLMQSKKLV